MKLILQAIKALFRKVDNGIKKAEESVEAVRGEIPTKLSDLEIDMSIGGEEYDLDVYQDDSDQWVMEKGDFDSLYEKLSNAESVNCRIRSVRTNYCNYYPVLEIKYDGDDDEIELRVIYRDGICGFYLSRSNEFSDGGYQQFQFRT